jgi:antitoxin component of MazEF toxin-antitoxin module
MPQEKPQKPPTPVPPPTVPKTKSASKPKRPRSKKLNISKKKEWESLLKEVDKLDIPIELLEAIVVNLKDGTQVTIEVKELISEGYDPQELRDHLDERLDSLDHMIDEVDFYISVDEVMKTVTPATEHLLKNL